MYLQVALWHATNTHVHTHTQSVSRHTIVCCHDAQMKYNFVRINFKHICVPLDAGRQTTYTLIYNVLFAKYTIHWFVIAINFHYKLLLCVYCRRENTTTGVFNFHNIDWCIFELTLHGFFGWKMCVWVSWIHTGRNFKF